jgi:hypothetical protein
MARTNLSFVQQFAEPLPVKQIITRKVGPSSIMIFTCTLTAIHGAAGWRHINRTSTGRTKSFAPGEVILVEDTTGKPVRDTALKTWRLKQGGRCLLVFN